MNPGEVSALRITCVIHSLAGGGAERLMAGLVRRIAAQHEVTLVTLDAAENDRYECGADVTRVALDLMRNSSNPVAGLFRNLHRTSVLRAAVKEASPDVVLSFCDKTNILTLQATRPLGVPTVFSEHTQPAYQDLGFLWGTLRRWNYPRASAGIVLTDDAREVVRRWTAAPLDVIPPAVDTPELEFPKYETLAREKVLVSVGRLSREKRIDRLIDAFSQLPSELGDWRLNIFGDGDQFETLKSQIEKLQLQHRISLSGWCDDVWRVLSEAAAFAMTSEYEGFPVALMEAMAAGLPCLSTDCESGPREILQHDVNGLLIQQDDQEALRTGLARLLGDADLRQRLADKTAGFADQFGWERFVASHEQVLTRAIASRAFTGS